MPDPTNRKMQRQRMALLAPHAHLIGTMPDRLLAKKVGVPVGTLNEWRRQHGQGPTGWDQRQAQLRAALLDRCVERLGTVPDAVLAKEAGVSIAAVSGARYARNIAPHPADVRKDEMRARYHARRSDRASGAT